MRNRGEQRVVGMDRLRLAVIEHLDDGRWCAADSTSAAPAVRSGPAGGSPGSDLDVDPEARRLRALVDLAKGGDVEAFGQLYDHYAPGIYRFAYYRVGSPQLAEDVTADTFFRALRSLSTFRWQGKDFGSWLVTIARNLITDHFKSSRSRLEHTTDDLSAYGGTTDGPEDEVIAALTNEVLLDALGRLSAEQQECLVLRFLRGCSISETAEALGRSEGAIKQLQLRAIRNLTKTLPEGLR